MTRPEPWSRLAASATLRIASWLDREPFSATYGCFDRTYWCWKFVDHPGARFQEAVATFAHHAVFGLPPGLVDPALGERAQRHLVDWCAAGIRFWARIQHRDGSFDEAYPYERSLAATAFTGFYVGEALELLGDRLDHETRELGHSTLARAARWLGANDEHHGLLSNHLAAAAAACEVARRVLDDPRAGSRRDHFLERIYARQSEEGWYEEYGGADPGYQTHGSFYLARIWSETRDQRLLDSLARATKFLTWMIHPDGTVGGEHASRNTEVTYPAAFEILAPELPEAASIAASLRRSLPAGRAVGLPAIDRWNLLPQTNNLLAASRFAAELQGDEDARLPCYGAEGKDFPDAGIHLRATPKLWVVVGLSKGGVVKAWDRESLQPAADCGWWIRLRNGAVASSQSLCRGADAKVGVEDRLLEVEAPFVAINQRLLTPWSMMAFRLSTLTLGRMPTVARWIKRLLVRVLVRRRRVVPLTLERSITIHDDHIEIQDRLVRPRRARAPIALGRGSRFATIHMGSSRYAAASELVLEAPREENELLALLARDEVVTAERVLEPGARA